MRRRAFLKLVGLASVAGSLPWVSAVAAASRRPAGSPAATQLSAPGSRLYQGRGGRIYMSSDAGRSWQLHTDLGPEYDVRRVLTDDAGGATARVGYGGRSFRLTLAPDLRSWLTD